MGVFNANLGHEEDSMRREKMPLKMYQNVSKYLLVTRI